VAPSRVRITSVIRTPSDDPWDRIRTLGGTGPGGTRWQLAESDAIAQIEDGSFEFYLGEDDNMVDLIVATHSGHKYLKTELDDAHPSKLLALPECP
jgi:hypothetical protein